MDDIPGSISSSRSSGSGPSGQLSEPGERKTTNEDDLSHNQDSDSSSSTSSRANSYENELDRFRLQWRRELETSPNQSTNLTTSKGSGLQENDILKQAKALFLRGVQEERTGRLYEAISFYKKAMQLVPDVEFLLAENHGVSGQNSSGDECLDESDEDGDREMSEKSLNDNNDDNEEITDLITHIEYVLLKSGSIQTCRPAQEQKSTHLSSLPTEVFIYILKWIVSGDLDLQSLDHISGVCRGFYLCSRDTEIWRLACIRVWGGSCGLPNKYGSWRNMFLNRPHLWFNGVYISKTTYVRFGESSFQDCNYKPCYVVEYFRYLRFFQDGTVLMLTTPDDPYQSLSKLKLPMSRHTDVLKGHYRLVGTCVTAILKRPHINNNCLTFNNNRRQRRQPLQGTDTGEENFHLELDIQPVKKRPHCKLLWRHYSVHRIYRNCEESVSEFDLTPSNFPPFWFSRVRSFITDLPLQ